MPAAAQRAGRLLPILALMLNALTWGVSWWPFRELQARGLHPLWATAGVYTLPLLVITLWRPAAWAQLLRTRALWPLVLASGTTNACFNWGVTLGDVVRVVLLFYLMPLWAVLLARWVLGEALGSRAWLRTALALAGAAIVLWPPAGTAGLPWPATLAEWLGLAGGFMFALNNVLLRRESAEPEAARALAMFLGGTLVAGALAAVLALQGTIAPPPPPAAGWLAAGAAMGLVFLAGNLALQYGAARLPAQVTAVVMVSEVVFASALAVLLGAGTLSAPLLAGGALIVAASLLAGRD